jgi:hypothetical protein
MKKLVLGIVALALLACVGLLAQVQDISGTWQGSLSAGGSRINQLSG